MDDFLARRHDAYTTRPDEIAAVVGKVTRQPIAGYEKRVRGYDTRSARSTTAARSATW